MKFSITIPAYKAKFFKECLDSVLNQTYDDYEVVILNDCSPEGIKEIVDNCRLRKNGDKIRYYENEKNVGAVDIVDNWNKLLELSRGEYIICMGDDDKLHSRHLEICETVIGNHPVIDLFHTRTEIINEQSDVIGFQPLRAEWESVYEMLWEGICGSRVQFIGDFVFKVYALKKCGGFFKMPLAYISDWISCMEVAKKNGIININEPLFYYRSSTLTITSTGNRRLMIDSWKKYMDWISDFLTEDPHNETDKKLKHLVQLNLERCRVKSIIDDIALDIMSNLVKNALYWYSRRSDYGLSRSNIIYATLLAVYRKHKME